MKYIAFFIGLSVFFACSKEGASTAKSSTTEDGERWQQMSDFMRGAMEVDYTMDFPATSGALDKNLKPSNLEIEYIQVSSHRDPIFLQNKYSKVKRQLVKWLEDNSDGKYSRTIQSISLRYMRYLFIPDDSKSSLVELQFLMDLIMKTNPIDLDVLADAYLKIKDNLDKNTDEMYMHHLNSVYTRYSSEIKSQSEELEREFRSSTGRERAITLMKGKQLERISKSCSYVRELLNLKVIEVLD